MNNATDPSEPKPSELVTVVAWINMTVCGLGAAIFLILLILFATLVPTEEMLAAMRSEEGRQMTPPALEFAMAYIQEILAALLALSVVALIASWALLKRRNWARLFWIAVSAAIVVWSIAGLFVHPDMAWFVPGWLKNAPPEVQEQLKDTMATAEVWGVAVSLVQAGLFAWLIWRFSSADIRREFKARR